MGWGKRPLFFAALAAVAVIIAVATGPVSAARSRATDRSAPRVRIQKMTTAARSTDPQTVASVRAEADWILSAQLADGAIAHYPDKVRILPYLSHFAALGLVRASAVTGEPRYVQGAWRWLRWYQDHQTTQGFVTDYTVAGDALTSTGDMDSTDSYAGLFLHAAWTAYEQTRDTAALRALRPGISGAVRAIEATLDGDRLTWAKPAWRVKYLMDQAEVHVGLRAASKLFAALGDQRSARLATTRARDLKAAIDLLWQPGTSSYDWAVHDDGARTKTDWTSLYPDAMQQVWTMAFGVASSGAGAEILAKFRTQHPYWASPEQVDAKTTDVEPYWPVAGWAMPSAERPAAGRSILDAALRAERAWPYHPGIAGQVIVLLSGGPDLP